MMPRVCRMFSAVSMRLRSFMLMGVSCSSRVRRHAELGLLESCGGSLSARASSRTSVLLN